MQGVVSTSLRRSRAKSQERGCDGVIDVKLTNPIVEMQRGYFTIVVLERSSSY
jgi:hypothetical protein